MFPIRDCERDIDGSGLGVVVPVTEFCDRTWKDRRNELLEGPWAFGDEHREEDFGACTEQGAFGYEAQAGKVHVCAGEDASVCGEGFGASAGGAGG